MKNLYLSIVFLLTVLTGYGQGYQFGIVHVNSFDFKVVAIPDFDSSGNTDISDVGFTLMLPAGNADITNVAGQLSGRVWSTTEFDAATLTGGGLGDGTRDAWLFNLPPGQTLLAHTNGQQIDLVTFTVSNTPGSGVISLLDNSDPIAIGASGVLDSFYNSNIDNTTTQDYFAGIAAGLGSFDFATLAVQDEIFNSSLKIYPNPTSDYVNVVSPAPLKTAVMFNMIGNRVLIIDNPDRIDVRRLSSGLYFIEVTDQDNRKAVRKIVIER